MISRSAHIVQLSELLKASPVVAMFGPRQVGKTTLAKDLAAGWNGPVRYFDLENPEDQARLADPAFVLGPLTGLVVLDEIQARPDLFPILKTLVDRPELPVRFLMTISVSPDVIVKYAGPLADITLVYVVDGLSLDEFSAGLPGTKRLEERWLRGGFPASLLAADLAGSRLWRDAFIRTYLERYLPQVGITLPAITMRRFCTMLAHYHGQTWNGSELGRSMGVSDKTAARYLDILAGTCMVFRLLPWNEHTGKRELKAPRIYLADTGILHSLLGIGSMEDLLAHPKCGASWEGFMVHEIIRRTGARQGEAFFWGVHTGAELDLLIIKDGKRLGFEIKLTRTPQVTPSMRSALDILGLDHLYVVYHGDGAPSPLHEKITALPAACMGLPKS